MASANPLVKDVTEATFEQDVLQRSQAVPVLVDFWAEWCGPCRVLGPLIEKEVAALEGKVELVKINTDQNQNLAQQFHIQSIPAVKVFYQGQVVDEFVGALPVPMLREFLQRLVPSESQQGMAGAIAHLEAGRMAEAATALAALVDDETLGSDAGFHLAHVLLHELAQEPGSVERARDLAAKVASTSDLQPRVAALLALADLVAAGLPEVGNLPALRARVQANRKDQEAHFALACALLASGDVEASMNALLEGISADARWNEAAARKAMVTIFNHMEEPGRDSELAFNFRRKLQVLL